MGWIKWLFQYVRYINIRLSIVSSRPYFLPLLNLYILSMLYFFSFQTSNKPWSAWPSSHTHPYLLHTAVLLILSQIHTHRKNCFPPSFAQPAPTALNSYLQPQILQDSFFFFIIFSLFRYASFFSPHCFVSLHHSIYQVVL